MSLKQRLNAWARTAKLEVLTVYFAARDPETPFFVRLLALIVAAYALSPIDLIPDFIPVIGYLDDLLLIPLGLLLVVRLLPRHVVEASRRKAEALLERPRSYVAAAFFILIWLAVLGAIVYWLIANAS